MKNTSTISNNKKCKRKKVYYKHGNNNNAMFQGKEPIQILKILDLFSNINE